MKTKVDIISGFLGAGKTTLIRKLLEEKFHNEKLVIIENEFGEVGIDGKLLKSSNVEVKEINSGCICCTLVGDFGRALEEVITQYRPDRIIIEPSGVGKLSDVLKACDTPKLKDLLIINMLIAVVDVLKYHIYISNFGEFFENQIKNAKTIILSRTQKSDGENLELAVSSIRKLNNKANIITTPWESLSAEVIIGTAEQDAASSLENHVKNVVLMKHSHHADCKCGCNHRHTHDHPQNHSAEEVFDVWGVETPKQFSENELKEILTCMGNNKSYGMILRGKGIIQLTNGKWLQFDYVPGEYELKDTSPDYTGRLCVIGNGLKKSKLYELFQVKE